jgi:hypothetical protein
VVYPHNVVLFSDKKKKWVIKPLKDRNYNFILLNERKSEKVHFYVISTLWYSGKSKIKETVKKISGCPGFRDWTWRMSKWSTENFQSSLTTLYDTIRVDIKYQYCMFVKSIESTTQRVNPNIKYGF